MPDTNLQDYEILDYRVPKPGERYIVPEEYSAIKYHPARVVIAVPFSRSVQNETPRPIVRKRVPAPSEATLKQPPEEKRPIAVINVDCRVNDESLQRLKNTIAEAHAMVSPGAYITNNTVPTEREVELTEAARELIDAIARHAAQIESSQLTNCAICNRAVAKVEGLINDNNEEQN